jgi:peptidoglycan/xylan/chitin deacetylase (PgdA/CDA1 family)
MLRNKSYNWNNELYIAAILVPLFCFMLGGCTKDLTSLEKNEPARIVITFDDGPLPADVADPEIVPERETLLVPLEKILDTLNAHDAQAVFYIKGPGTAKAGEILADIFFDGLNEIHSAGHIMGYHAYQHEPSIWGLPLQDSFLRQRKMRKDLQSLASYVETVTKGEIKLAEVFRQPYGGDRVCRIDGWTVATSMGLTYHGYDIDSFDWTENTDVNKEIIRDLPVITEEDHMNFIRKKFHEQAIRHADDAVVDVLFHVNHFTADHLGELIDLLREEFEHSTGRSVLFKVPKSYLKYSEPYIDTLILDYIFLGR